MSGLIGAGRTEVVEAIFGLRRIDKGVIKINGKPVTISSPVAALEHGLAFLTENRRLTGIFPMLSVSNNVVISSLKQCLGKMNLISHRKAYSFVDEFIDMLDIKTPSVHQSVENLSGGNQQKVLIARWLMTQPTILFLDEPTRGIDVGSKSEIHRLISDLVGEGKSVVMVSSELPEIMGMSDRIVVMHEGHVTGIVENHEDLTQDELMLYATGQKDQFKKLDEVS
jgi:methyl-galactoside transport system ATP-binding protein/inositol transport system ATP-binding protein